MILFSDLLQSHVLSIAGEVEGDDVSVTLTVTFSVTGRLLMLPSISFPDTKLGALILFLTLLSQSEYRSKCLNCPCFLFSVSVYVSMCRRFEGRQRTGEKRKLPGAFY